jgi:hypothetical protein
VCVWTYRIILAKGIKVAKNWIRFNRDFVDALGIEAGIEVALRQVSESGFRHALRHCAYPV